MHDRVSLSGGLSEGITISDSFAARDRNMDTREFTKSFGATILTKIESLSLQQHIMNERLPKVMEICITPSEYKKSEHKETFMDLMMICGFGRLSMLQRMVKFDGMEPANSEKFNFSFQWNGQKESASYEPLINHMHSCGLDPVLVSDGQMMPDGLLFREEIWTLKTNISVSSEELRKEGKQSLLKYIIQGRTDIVRVQNPRLPLGNHNNRYFIEIKRVEDFSEEHSLREACLQLIGGTLQILFIRHLCCSQTL